MNKRIETANNEWIRICKAKELLDMELADTSRMSILMEDVVGLKNVWAEINKVWSHIDVVNDTPFSAYVYKKVKETLDKCLDMMQEFPNRVRQYQVYDEYKSMIQKYKKVNGIYQELKSEAMKQKHWK
jgi:dynein heavy chain 1